MKKRAYPVLYVTATLVFALLLFLSWLVSTRGDLLDVRRYQISEESEPNDTVETADPIALGQTIAGRIPFTQTGDIDWYELTLSSADLGRDMQASLEEPFPDPDYILRLDLFDEHERLLLSAASDTVTTLDWTAGATTYYLRVQAAYISPRFKDDARYELTGAFAPPRPTSTPYPYPQQPTLWISDHEGAPGSVFTLTGFSFPESDQVSIRLNGQFIGAVPGSLGGFYFFLHTAWADEGLYVVTTTTKEVTRAEFFVLDADEPLRETQEDGPSFPVPWGIAFHSRLFLPALLRNE